MVMMGDDVHSVGININTSFPINQVLLVFWERKYLMVLMQALSFVSTMKKTMI
jgi:hypothetical protein